MLRPELFRTGQSEASVTRCKRKKERKHVRRRSSEKPNVKLRERWPVSGAAQKAVGIHLWLFLSVRKPHKKLRVPHSRLVDANGRTAGRGGGGGGGGEEERAGISRRVTTFL